MWGRGGGGSEGGGGEGGGVRGRVTAEFIPFSRRVSLSVASFLVVFVHVFVEYPDVLGMWGLLADVVVVLVVAVVVVVIAVGCGGSRPGFAGAAVGGCVSSTGSSAHAAVSTRARSGCSGGGGRGSGLLPPAAGDGELRFKPGAGAAGALRGLDGSIGWRYWAGLEATGLRTHDETQVEGRIVKEELQLLLILCI